MSKATNYQEQFNAAKQEWDDEFRVLSSEIDVLEGEGVQRKRLATKIKENSQNAKKLLEQASDRVDKLEAERTFLRKTVKELGAIQNDGFIDDAFENILKKIVENPEPGAHVAKAESESIVQTREFIKERNQSHHISPPEYGGIGIEVVLGEQGVEIKSIARDSNAEFELEAGDKIVAAEVDRKKLPTKFHAFINDEEKIDFTQIKDKELLVEALALVLRGMPGTEVSLEVERNGEPATKGCTFERQLFGRDSSDELTAFTRLSKIEPSAEMKARVTHAITMPLVKSAVKELPSSR